MSDTLSTVILGIVEGITEFLPISSTGHLVAAEHWLGERSELFNVGIQAGAILAIAGVTYGFRLAGPLCRDRISIPPAAVRVFAVAAETGATAYDIPGAEPFSHDG